jgi:hypothetical protein
VNHGYEEEGEEEGCEEEEVSILQHTGLVVRRPCVGDHPVQSNPGDDP